jgi:predicted helicase
MNHFFVSDTITETKCGESTTQSAIFPLYTYITPKDSGYSQELFSTRKANFNPAFVKELGEKLGLQFVEDGKGDLRTTFGPEDVFHYTYAVFHSPTYRSRYADFLRIDFPRLPLTSDKKLFAALVKKGEELVSLHLLKSPKVDNFITSYPEAGNNVVEKVVFTPDPKGLERPLGSHGRVWINTQQYFGGVPQEVWEFKVGGYQVCEKWLKDRKGRLLSGEDITHYQRVVVALKETIRLMQEVDKSIPGWPMA